jgi:hypothetical protein
MSERCGGKWLVCLLRCLMVMAFLSPVWLHLQERRAGKKKRSFDDEEEDVDQDDIVRTTCADTA